MSWALGLSIWIVAGLGVAWVFGEIARRTDRVEREDDWLADRKRRIDQRGNKTRAGLR
jgi:hypothetical protein